MRIMRPGSLSRYVCVFASLLAPLAAFCSPQDDAPRGRLLNGDEGLTLVNTASEQQSKAGQKPDCSHLVQRIYELSGFPYPYASSYDLYEGIANFRRVSIPRPGDLVVWRGHVGIVINAIEHTFYSSVSTGFRTEYYDSPYWRAQGRPRFYRYVLSDPTDLTATNASAPVNTSVAQAKKLIVPAHKEIADAPQIGTNLPVKVDAQAPSSSATVPSNRPLALPSSILVGAAANRPTSEEIGDAISEFNSAAGNLLHEWPFADSKRIVLVYDQLRVERIELKHDRGWVNVELEERLSFGNKAFEEKRRVEKLRWQLRRTPQGWQLQVPANCTYVPRDAAIRALAAQLAALTQHEFTPDDSDRSLRQERVIVRALDSLLEPT